MRVDNYATQSAPTTQGWQAKLDLAFAKPADKTVLVGRQHHGPLVIQRPFYPEGEVCHVYLLHPPGGVVGGDELTVNISAGNDSHALLTTPAASKFYRSNGILARQTVVINIEDGAMVEWLPQETIIYEGAQLKSQIKVDLAAQAKFIGWEILSLGRPASGEGFDQGQVDLLWQIHCNEQPMLRERLRLDALAFAARWGLQGFSACGTLFAKPVNKVLADKVRFLFQDKSLCGVTLIDDLLICRALDTRSDKIRGFYEQIWQVLRPEVTGKSDCPPRIWAT